MAVVASASADVLDAEKAVVCSVGELAVAATAVAAAVAADSDGVVAMLTAVVAAEMSAIRVAAQPEAASCVVCLVEAMAVATIVVAVVETDVLENSSDEVVADAAVVTRDVLIIPAASQLPLPQLPHLR